MKKKNPPLSVLGSGGKRGACFSCNANSEKLGQECLKTKTGATETSMGADVRQRKIITIIIVIMTKTRKTV